MAISIHTKENINLSSQEKKLAELKKTQQMFFKLLTTQLQCQDIDNPVDMNQMTQNLFQMNELQTLISIDGKLDDLNENIKSSEPITLASNIIGKYVVTKSNKISVNGQTAMNPVNYIIEGNGENINALMKIIDENGNVVHEQRMSNISTNTMQNLQLNFEGPNGVLTVPEGIYNIQLFAYDKDNKPLKAEIFTTNKIQQSLINGNFITSSNEKIKLQDIFAIQETPVAVKLEYNPFTQGQLKQNISDFMKKAMV